MSFGRTEEELFAASLYEFLLKTDLKDCFNDNDAKFFGFEIVDRPLGDRQCFDHRPIDDDYGEQIEMPKEFAYIDHEYCEQYCGVCGDDFFGWLYFPLPNGKYIKCQYDC